MYYITPKSSKTGKKLAAVIKKGKECIKAQHEMAKKYGFQKWSTYWLAAIGGISEAFFEIPPDKKTWCKTGFVKSLNTFGYYPKAKTMRNEFDNMPKVFPKEINACIGWDEEYSHIGYVSNDHYFGISLEDDWEIKMPDDCKEVTTSEYKKKFKKQELAEA